MAAHLLVGYNNLMTLLFMLTRKTISSHLIHLKQSVFQHSQRLWQLFMARKRLRVIVISGLLVGLGIIVGLRIASDESTPTVVQPTDPALAKSQGVLTKQDPPFDAKTPRGESLSGRWTRVSPPDRNPAYAYTDSVDGIKVIVTEQPLPKELRSDIVASTKALAAGYSATQTLDVPGATTFIGTSAKGPQSVIMTKDNLLVLVKSSQRIPNAAWEQYLKELR